MPGCPIIRITKHKTQPGLISAVGHHLRTIPTKNADPSLAHLNQVTVGPNGDEGPATLAKLIDDIVTPLKKRKDNVTCLELLLGASDEFWDAGGSWKELAKAHEAMLASEFGTHNIIGLGWHLDEQSPHGWAFITPVTRDGRLAASHWIDGPVKLRQMLTRIQPFYNPLGLERAAEGVRQHHVSMREIHSANAGNRDAKRRLDRELKTRADNAKQRILNIEKAAIEAEAKAKSKALELDQIRDEIADAKASLGKERLLADAQLKARSDHLEKQIDFVNSVAECLKNVLENFPDQMYELIPSAISEQIEMLWDIKPIRVNLDLIEIERPDRQRG